MKKLTYTNDQQIISDAAQMLLEAHLHWSSSEDGMPSKDLDGVRGMVMSAYLEANFTEEEWEAMSSEERATERVEPYHLFKQAAQLADRKWQAAMTLLGIE